MSLIGKVEVSEAKVAANRASAQRSTGPRTPAGKRRSRLNALQHGRFASPACWSAESLRALGEDPQEFQALRERLRRGENPPDALEEQQIEDLARLYWQRRRLDRAWEALVRRARKTSEEDAALLPVSEQGARLLDRLEVLDRAIDRKVRILLRLREARQRQQRWEARQGKSLMAMSLGGAPRASRPRRVQELEQELHVREAELRHLEALSGEIDEKLEGTKPGSV